MTDPSRGAGRAPPSSDLPSLSRAARPSRRSLAGSEVAVVDGRVGPRVAGNDGAGDGQAAPAHQKSWFSRTRDGLRGRKVPRWTSKGAAAGLVTTGLGGGIATAVAVAAGKGAAIGGAAGLGVFGVGALGGALIGGAIGAVGAILVGGGIGYLAAGGWAGRDAAEQTIDSLRGKGLITGADAERLKSLSSAELGGLCKLSDRDLGIGNRAERQRMRSAIREHLVLKAAREGVPAANTLKAALLDDYGDLGRVRRGYEVIDLNAPPQVVDSQRIAATLSVDWDARLRGDESLRLIAPLLSQDDQQRIVGWSRDATLEGVLQRVDQEVPVEHRTQARAAILLQVARRGPQAAAGLLDQLMQQHRVELSWQKKVKVKVREKEPHLREVSEPPWGVRVERQKDTVPMHGYESLDTWWARERGGGQEADPDGPWRAIHQGQAPDLQAPSYRAVEKALADRVQRDFRGQDRDLRDALDVVMYLLGPMDEATRFADASEFLGEITEQGELERLQALKVLGAWGGEWVSRALGGAIRRVSPALRDVLPAPGTGPRIGREGETARALQRIATIDPKHGAGPDAARRLNGLSGWHELRPKMMRLVATAERDLAPLQDEAQRLAGGQPRPLRNEDARLVDDRPLSPAADRPDRRVTLTGEVEGAEFAPQDAPAPIDRTTQPFADSQILALRLSCLMMEFALASYREGWAGSVKAAVAATLEAADGHGRSVLELEKTLQELNRKADPPRQLTRPSIRSAWESDDSPPEERPAGTVRVAPDGRRGILKHRATSPPPPPSEDDGNPIERAQAQSADDEKDRA